MEAIGLGIESLRELGITVPAADRLAGELDHQFDHLYRWLDHTEAADDRARPDITEPTLLTAARLLSAVGPAGGLLRPEPRHGRLVEPGGAADLARARPGPAPCSARPPAALAAVARAATTPPATWFEPIESGLHEIRRAREGLLAGGELAMVGYTYHEAVYHLLDCVPTLDSFVAEVEAGWPLCAGPIASRPARCSTATGGWLCCAGKRRRGGEAVPSTSTPTTRWRFSTLMSARRSRPPLARIPDITPVSPHADRLGIPGGPGAARLWCPHGTQRSDGGGAPRPAGMIRTVGGERDGQQGGRRGTTEIASRAFDVVVAGLVLLVVWPVLAAVASAIRVVATDVRLYRCDRGRRDGFARPTARRRRCGAMSTTRRCVDSMAVRHVNGSRGCFDKSRSGRRCTTNISG